MYIKDDYRTYLHLGLRFVRDIFIDQTLFTYTTRSVFRTIQLWTRLRALMHQGVKV